MATRRRLPATNTKDSVTEPGILSPNITFDMVESYFETIDETNEELEDKGAKHRTPYTHSG